MDRTRIRIELGSGAVEAEGSEEFVRWMLAESVPLLAGIPTPGFAVEDEEEPAPETARPRKILGLVETADVDVGEPAPSLSETAGEADGRPMDSPHLRLRGWYATLTVPPGRRSVMQDRTIAFLYWYCEVEPHQTARAKDLGECFEIMGFFPPASIPNMVANLRKTTNWLRPNPHGRRDQLRLTSQGKAYIESRFKMGQQ